MSDDIPHDDETVGFDAEDIEAEYGADDDEYEEISSDEVDRVVAALEDLIETVDSENVRLQLEEALNNVYYLVYDENDENEALEEAA